jgi:hypothetical protein
MKTTIKNKMAAEVNPVKKKSSTSHQEYPYCFLCFALQCASTLALPGNQFLKWLRDSLFS